MLLIVALSARSNALIDNWGWFWFIVVVTLIVCILYGILLFTLMGGGGPQILVFIFGEICLLFGIPSITVLVIEKVQDFGGVLHRPHIHVSGWGIVWLLIALLIGEAMALAALRAPRAIPLVWVGTAALIGGGSLVAFVFHTVTAHAGIGSVLGVIAAGVVGMLLVFVVAFVGRAVAR